MLMYSWPQDMHTGKGVTLLNLFILKHEAVTLPRNPFFSFVVINFNLPLFSYSFPITPKRLLTLGQRQLQQPKMCITFGCRNRKEPLKDATLICIFNICHTP